MAVDLDSGTGLFDRLGRLGHVLNLCDAFFSGASAGNIPVELNDLLVKYDGSSNEVRGAVSALTQTLINWQLNQESFYSDLQRTAQQTLVEMVDADDPLPVRDVYHALFRLIEQMNASSDTVDANEPTISVAAAAGNTGTATVFASLTDGKGRTMQNAFAEDIILTVESDSVARGESILVESEEDQALGVNNPNWPDGSGSQDSITVIDPSSDGVLINGDFESFTGSNPDSWDVSGSAIHGPETTTVHLGSKAIKFTGNGAATANIFQEITGLESNTNYILAFSYYLAVLPAAGSLRISIKDSGGTILTSHTVTLSSATAGSWQEVATAFRLSSPIPDPIRFHIEVLGPLSNTRVLIVDDVCFGVEPTQLYEGGPFLAVVGGTDTLAVGDNWKVTVANDRRGAFQTLFARLFEEPSLFLPSATGGSETINDSLIG